MFRNLFETHPVWKKKNVPVCTGAADALHARGPLEVWQSKTLDYCELFSPLAFQSLTHSVCMQSDQGTYRPEDKNSRAWRRGIRLKWRCHPLSFPQVSLQHWCCCLQVVSTLPPPLQHPTWEMIQKITLPEKSVVLLSQCAVCCCLLFPRCDHTCRDWSSICGLHCLKQTQAHLYPRCSSSPHSCAGTSPTRADIVRL